MEISLQMHSDSPISSGEGQTVQADHSHTVWEEDLFEITEQGQELLREDLMFQ